MQEQQPGALPGPAEQSVPQVAQQPVALAAPTAPQAAPHPYPWAQQTVRMRVQTEPLEYHRLQRGLDNYRWYKPLLLALLGTAYYLAASIVIGIGFAVLMLLTVPFEEMTAESFGASFQIDTQNPGFLVLALVSVILMLPCGWLAALTLGVRPTGRLFSAALKIRWDLLGSTMVLAVIVLGIVQGGATALQVLIEPGSLTSRSSDFSELNMWVSLLFIVLLVPFQAAAEEYVFRGFLLQMFGAWVKKPWLTILLTSLMFGAMHIYDFWGLAAVTLMGATAAWITIRTGGLEAAISLHVVNNLIAFGLMATGYFGSTAQEQTVAEGISGLGLLATEIIVLALYVLGVELLWRNQAQTRGWGRKRYDRVLRDVPVAQLTPAQLAEVTPVQVQAVAPAQQPPQVSADPQQPTPGAH